ncbi:gluconokinase [Ralstonia solanacearum]|uniref:Gluconokinase n=1 Tax=Ralstonia solanacearum (strain Po82) TaxID=1031711 RepID=F6G5E8_RALS8|nr:gluconokinase [Ralstonia solanacearum]AEG70249.1 thermoresistant gluconokinase (gluconate kinase 2) protein [Ralstonia solanacearum Po82]AMP68374.1 gluconate kinase [Ralstonia solanacearum]AMP74717.1 gluconate kinase [Ralstonia solanacearum]AYB61659.1 gluconokinase [Ralstonia solanacearum]MBB6585453.1 gluconokinase [Ralstonia solanacearum]
MIVVVMGVSGCGKSTVGRMIAERLGCAFRDGDEFHSEANRAKMHAGIPLNDDDRKPWLETIRAYMDETTAGGRSLVVACSALKQRYRDVLSGPSGHVAFVYLKGDFELLQGRLAARTDHFFNPALLRSQFDALEEPADAIVVDIALPPETLVQQAVERLQARIAQRPAA